MSNQPTSAAVEAILQVWERGPANFGGRVVYGTTVRRRLEGCSSADGVKILASAFGEHVDRAEVVDPVPWEDIVAENPGPKFRGSITETVENDLIESLLRLNTGQLKRLVGQLAARSLDDRAQFVEHCNDLAAAVTRTMVGHND